MKLVYVRSGKRVQVGDRVRLPDCYVTVFSIEAGRPILLRDGDKYGEIEPAAFGAKWVASHSCTAVKCA
jgi:hypothetical protein